MQSVVTNFLWKEQTMKRFLLFALLFISAVSFAQDSTKLPDNKTLLAKAHSFYVDSDSFYMKREALESSLLGQAEFKAWDLQITNRKDLADMVVHVKRVPFSNHFSYTVTDRETETIVMAGKVDSLAGTVYGQVAKEIVHKMKMLRGDPVAAAKLAQ
jgi:outer membrane lipopolysaccharide assembly protein LptE/RlpB